jgi:hypothetical protein
LPPRDPIIGNGVKHAANAFRELLPFLQQCTEIRALLEELSRLDFGDDILWRDGDAVGSGKPEQDLLMSGEEGGIIRIAQVTRFS